MSTDTTGPYRRAGLIVAGFALALAACGGSDAGAVDESGGSISSETSGSDSGSVDSGSGDAGVTRTEAINVDAVVDTCAILPAQQVSDLSNSFGGFLERDYVGETDGAACVYTWETAIVRVVIGSSSQLVNEAPPSLILGELTSRPWPADGAVTIWGDEWSGVTTDFFAHLESGEYGITIQNINGTSIDSSGEGDLYGQVLLAAAANLG